MRDAVLRRPEMIVHDLTLGLDEAQRTLTAIRNGEVDALVVATSAGDQVFVMKGADHAYRILFEALSEGAMTIAPDTTILYANERLAEMLGRPLHKVLGELLTGFIAPAHGARFAALVALAERGRSRGELSLVAHGGAPVPVMVSLSAISSGEAGAFTVVMTDLTPLKGAEAALRSANDDLEARVASRTEELSRANEALRAQIAESARLAAELQRRAGELVEADRRKDEFLSMLAHELRNPLAPILAAGEMIRFVAKSQPALQRYGAVIGRQVRNLARLVDDLLDVSRITRGAITLRRQEVELAAVVRSAVDSARPLVEASGHHLSVTLPDRAVRLVGDPTRFEQVLVNLLNNAAKYTEHGGRISLSAEVDGGQVVVRVRDTGVGMSAELLARVFDLFVQGDRSLDRSQGGLGIGLTLVKSLVEMHGGAVEAHSDGPGHGSELVVRLPLAPDAEAPSGAAGRAGADGAGPEEAARRSESEAPPASRSRVLVVEDNLDAANTLAELLTLWGHDVRRAHDGDEALRAAAAFQPQVALVDIGLPGMDGYEVARRLRGSARAGDALVLIGITGYGQDEDRSRALAAGFDHHLVKPPDPDVLRALLGVREAGAVAS